MLRALPRRGGRRRSMSDGRSATEHSPTLPHRPNHPNPTPTHPHAESLPIDLRHRLVCHILLSCLILQVNLLK